MMGAKLFPFDESPSILALKKQPELSIKNKERIVKHDTLLVTLANRHKVPKFKENS